MPLFLQLIKFFDDKIIEKSMTDWVCMCMQVQRKEIVDTIMSKGLTTTKQVQEETDAGTCCGRCLPQIDDIVLVCSVKLKQS